MDHSSHSGHAHDHGSHGDHSSQTHGNHDSALSSATLHATSMMQTSFHFGTHEQLLFDWWATDGVWGMLASCIVVSLMALSYEGLKFLRSRLLTRSRQTRYSSVRTMNGINGESAPTPENEPIITMTSSCHLQQTAIYAVQLTLGYMLMLLFMYFNIWICLSIVSGATLGYFLFGWHTTSGQNHAADHCTA